jgi:hypothetical protein
LREVGYFETASTALFAEYWLAIHGLLYFQIGLG